MITNIPIRLDNISGIGELLKRNNICEWVFLDSRKIDNKLYPELAPGFLYPVYSKKNRKSGLSTTRRSGTMFPLPTSYYSGTLRNRFRSITGRKSRRESIILRTVS